MGQFMSLTQRSVVVIPPTEGLRLSGVLDSNKISDGQKKKIILLSMPVIQSSQVLTCEDCITGMLSSIIFFFLTV